jgi:uncharacterized protein (DUF433 family)
MRARSPTCKVCKLPPGERDLINGGLSAGWSPRRLAARFGTVSRKDVVFHAKFCGSEEEKEE